MTSEQSPQHTPPGLSGTDSNGEVDSSQIPLPRTASSAHSNPSSASRGRSGSIQSRMHTVQTDTGTPGHVPRSPSSHATSFAVSSASGAHAQGYPALPLQPTSTTHAGGILPSASFFHPSRPNHYVDLNNTNFMFYPGYNNNFPTLPLTSTVRSAGPPNASDPRPESTGSDSFAQHSFTTDEFGTGMARERGPPAMSTVGGTSTLSRSFSTKVSREPLLPIGQKAKTKIPSRPSISGTPGSRLPGIGGHSRRKSDNGSGGSGSGGGSSGGGVGRVRTSLEKFIRRTLSGDAGMSAVSIIKESTLPVSMEDVETRERGPSDQYMEFAGPDSAVDDDGTMNITHSASGMGSFAMRRGNMPLQRRFPSFNPDSPNANVPASRMPVLSESGKPMRNYQLHRSQNAFFCRGKLLTGGDSLWPFIGSLFVVLGLTGTWSGTTAVWWWKNESPAVSIIGAYMCLLTIVNMLATAFSDPGILPRNLDPDPPYNTPTEDGIRAPLPRDLKVRSGVVRVKYCQTCRIYRPPRSSHCRMCDNCVDGCDHHCQWVNNCVGRRNYTSFIVFLTSATLTACLIICTSALHLVIQAHREHLSAGASLRKGAGSAVVFVVSAIIVWPVGGLLGYHIRLLVLNFTTIEQIRNSAHKTLVRGPLPPNPFAFSSWRHNLAEMLCRPQGMSWLSASDLATEDKREPNPGSEIGSAMGDGEEIRKEA